MKAFDKIILNIPHSSTVGVFDKKIGCWQVNPFFFSETVLKHTDLYTDFLFQTDDTRVVPIVFPYSRFVCDAERLDDDPLEEIGQGILYKKFGKTLRGELDLEAQGFLLNERKKHLDALVSQLEENSIILDCHSFNSELARDVDICIGFNDDFSYDEEVVDKIAKVFKKGGYSVAFNHPYSNSITPTKDRTDYKSVMIEVRKSIYMNETIYSLNSEPRKWMRWYGTLKKLYGTLLGDIK